MIQIQIKMSLQISCDVYSHDIIYIAIYDEGWIGIWWIWWLWIGEYTGVILMA